MIENFKVTGFRLFDKIEIKKIKKINLIVGKNNAGKSALLESLLLYFSKISIDVLIELFDLRKENWESNINDSDISSPIRHLFKHHRIPELYAEGFTLSSNQSMISVETAAYIREETDNSITLRELKKDELVEFDSEFYEESIIVKENNFSRRLLSLNDTYEQIRRRVGRVTLTKKPKLLQTASFQYVSTNGISDLNASLLWDKISLTELEKEVIFGLQIIEPDISGLTFVDSGPRRHSNERIPLVKVIGVKEPVPLKSLGDGMTRIFHIILSLVSAKDGILIVDEFENGLHWSIQEDVWKMVFSLALSLNVQIFATTHSRDCVSGFQASWFNNKDDASFIRIVKDKQNSIIKEYDLELLSDSIETNVEVR